MSKNMIPGMIICSLLASLIFTACGSMPGSTPAQTGNHQSKFTATASNTTIPASATATPVPTSAETPPVSSTPTTNKNGPVSLTLDKEQYTSNDVITVTITNQFPQTIYVNGRYYNCLLVQIEKQSGTTWIPQGNCNRIQGFTPVRIQPGMRIQQQLSPGNETTRSTPQHLWNKGTYRITLLYQLNYDPDTIGGGIHIMTAPFTIT